MNDSASTSASTSVAPKPKEVSLLSEGKIDYFYYCWESSSDNSEERVPVHVTAGAISPKLALQLNKADNLDTWGEKISTKSMKLTLVCGASSVTVLYYITGNISNEILNSSFEGTAIKEIERGKEIDLDVDESPQRKRSSQGGSTPKAKLCIKIRLFILKATPFIPLPQGKLAEDLKSNFKAGLPYDKFEVAANGETFSASKHMLAIRSPMFQAMMSTDMKEKATNKTEFCIPDAAEPCDPKVCKELLSYIHTDEIPNISEMAEALWHAAHYYQMERLQAICENALADQLSEKNAAHLLVFANKYCEKESHFREFVISFVTKSNDTCKDIADTDDWELVKQQPGLTDEILMRLIQKKK